MSTSVPAGSLKKWIQMHPSGSPIYPLQPNPENFKIRDIAWHLAGQCRYAGGTSRHYSVAEHCVHVSRLVEKNGGCARFGFGHDLCARCIMHMQWGLMHDASEAFLGDMTRPTKHQAEMAPYRAAEDRMQLAITRWLGLPDEQPAIVKHWDTQILGTEARQLKRPVHPDWGKSCPGGVLPPRIPGLKLGLERGPARLAFLRRFARLFPNHKDT